MSVEQPRISTTYTMDSVTRDIAALAKYSVRVIEMAVIYANDTAFAAGIADTEHPIAIIAISEDSGAAVVVRSEHSTRIGNRRQAKHAVATH